MQKFSTNSRPHFRPWTPTCRIKLTSPASQILIKLRENGLQFYGTLCSRKICLFRETYRYLCTFLANFKDFKKSLLSPVVFSKKLPWEGGGQYCPRFLTSRTRICDVYLLIICMCVCIYFGLGLGHSFDSVGTMNNWSCTVFGPNRLNEEGARGEVNSRIFGKWNPDHRSCWHSIGRWIKLYFWKFSVNQCLSKEVKSRKPHQNVFLRHLQRVFSFLMKSPKQCGIMGHRAVSIFKSIEPLERWQERQMLLKSNIRIERI